MSYVYFVYGLDKYSGQKWYDCTLNKKKKKLAISSIYKYIEIYILSINIHRTQNEHKSFHLSLNYVD